jgi:hypothetical protein
VLDFTRVTESGERVLYTNSDRKTKALWNIFTDAGRRSVVLGWWNTFPVEEISGVMVAQVNTLEQLESRMWIRPGVGERGVVGQVYPDELRQEVFEVLEDVDSKLPELLDSIYPDTAASTSPADEAKWESCRWSVRADSSVAHIALELARTGPFPDLFLAHFGATDVIGHHFWRYHAPQEFRYPPSVARVENLGNVLTRTYQHVDSMIGELIGTMPTDTTVFILSDHGMQAKHADTNFDVEADDRAERESGGHGKGPEGVIVVAGPPIRSSGVVVPVQRLFREDLPLLGDVGDIAPTILALKKLPIGRDMDGAVLENLLKPGFLADLDLEFIDTHDTPQWLAGRNRERASDLPGQEERIEQLRSLGYLESDEDSGE